MAQQYIHYSLAVLAWLVIMILSNLARWVVGCGETGILKVCTGMCISFFVSFPIQYVYEFQYNMFSKRDGGRHEMENQSHPFSS